MRQSFKLSSYRAVYSMLMCSQWCTPFFCGTVTKWLLASTSCLYNSLALLCLKPIGLPHSKWDCKPDSSIWNAFFNILMWRCGECYLKPCYKSSKYFFNIVLGSLIFLLLWHCAEIITDLFSKWNVESWTGLQGMKNLQKSVLNWEG